MVTKKLHCAFATIAGVIALLADITGSIGLYGPLLTLATDYAPAEYVSLLGWLLLILTFLAALGGVIVILGGFVILVNRFMIGRFCIGMGIGFEALSAIYEVALFALGGAFLTALVGFVVLLTTLTGIAFILAIIALVVPISKEKI
jgi:hypothetical protein